MKPRNVLLTAAAAFAVSLVGCGDEQATAQPKRDPRYIDPSKYYGTYDGKRLDKESEGVDSVLVIHQGNSTYTMTHEGLEFGGNYAYLSGEMELYVYQVEGYPKTRLISENPGLDDETLKKYQDIMLNIYWRFEVLPDGFRMKASDRSPAMYEFKRRPAGAETPADEGGETPEGDWPRGIANMGGG